MTVKGIHRDVEVSGQLPGEITILRYPGKGFRAVLQKIFIGLWLVGWSAGEYDVGRLLALGLPYKAISNARYDVSTWCWFLFWTVAGLVVFAWLYAMIFARSERVTLTGDEIFVSYWFGHWHRSKRWEVPKMGNLRIRQVGRRGEACLIQFEYERKTRSLLPASDWASTQRVLEEMRAHGVRR